ncbi:amidohydrolase family protein [Streptomyces sp. SID8361]|uniref:amidohydrolase family protein n=1 Tax=Streptomyces sp. MnatMP-M27 TaxID=1839768 RepID=UPI00081DA62D|nr:amidohydrolase family protein [Streptomyces sp. MnatMP-M27]MYU11176.1 amidohydrolase family protein [Streptomyces sp. SID8361]SCF78924.1 Predicted metal-dependent hydrolase, TIM-barrel fold [Streptomyces sp. MnatMP-M27]
MLIIDGQMHSWRNSFAKHWWGKKSVNHWRDGYQPVSGTDDWPIESVLAAMEAVGAHAAVLDALPSAIATLPDGTRRWSNDYGEEASLRHPNVLASTARYEPTDPDIERLFQEARSTPGVVGVRLSIRTDREAGLLRTGHYKRYLSAAEDNAIPVFIAASLHLDSLAPAISAHPKVQFVVDHLGMPQPPLRQLDDPPFRRLPMLLDLARHDNVAVKFCGGPAYSAEGYPFADVWRHLRLLVDRYGAERLMWASDLTRFRGMYTYAELLNFIRYADVLSETEKSWILGRTLQRILKWPMNEETK